MRSRYEDRLARVLRGARNEAPELLDEARRRHHGAGEVVAMLAMPPSEALWVGLCHRLELARDELALGDVERRLDAWWPDRLRVLTAVWGAKLARGALDPALLALVRCVRLEHDDVARSSVLDPATGELSGVRILELEATRQGYALLAQADHLTGLLALRLSFPHRFTLEATTPFDATLLAAPHLRRLETLELDGLGVSIAAAGALAAAPGVDLLRRLAVRDCKLGPRHLTALLADSALGDLVELDLSENPLGPDAARRLAEAHHLVGLRALALRGCGLLEGSGTLVGAAHLQRLERLDLDANFAGPTLAEAFASSDAPMPDLVELRLARDRLGDDGFDALLGARQLTALRVLDVAHDELSDAAITRLVERSPWPALRDLGLGGNRLGDATVEQLVRWPALGELERLDLSETRVTARATHLLAGDEDTRDLALRELDLSATALALADTVRLVAAPALPALERLGVPHPLLGQSGNHAFTAGAARAGIALFTAHDAPRPARTPRAPRAPRPATREARESAEALVLRQRLWRLITAAPGDATSWREVCALLDALHPRLGQLEDLRVALDGKVHPPWPDAVRELPLEHARALAAGERAERFRVARAIAVGGDDDALALLRTILELGEEVVGPLRCVTICDAHGAALRDTLVAPALQRPRRVELVRCTLELDAERDELDHAPLGAAVHELVLRDCTLASTATAEALADIAWWPELRVLRLEDCALDDDMLVELVSVRSWDQLLDLSLAGNVLSDRGLERVGYLARFPALRRLDLSGNADVSVAALVSALAGGAAPALEALIADLDADALERVRAVVPPWIEVARRERSAAPQPLAERPALRELLAAAERPLAGTTFQVLCDIFDTLPHATELFDALDARLASWPDAARCLSPAALAATSDGAAPASARLARSVRVTGPRELMRLRVAVSREPPLLGPLPVVTLVGIAGGALEDWTQDTNLPPVRELTLERCALAAAAARHLARAPHLEHLEQLTLRVSDLEAGALDRLTGGLRHLRALALTRTSGAHLGHLAALLGDPLVLPALERVAVLVDDEGREELARLREAAAARGIDVRVVDDA